MPKNGLIFILAGLFIIEIFTTNGYTEAAELTPPYFNLAEGRKISATATCGVDTDDPELYCKLVGANTENDNQYYSLIQGQVCDYCDPTKPDRNHPPEHAIDGTANWWQSPPLSRGMKYNEVNLTIDFGQEFHVAYLYITMGNSPRPGLWTLEKSSDYGKTWTAWQHFSDTASDCEIYFGKESLNPIRRDDDVICTTEYSKIVPLEDGEIPVMLLNNRPSANNYFNSTVLQEWTRATNVRFRFLRTKNLLGHLMSVARQDPTVTRRYFYSIKDISIGGRCMCNGHADTCHVHEPSPTRVLACQCRHNTCGIQCAECCPGFVQKKWRQNTKAWPFQCEQCNCFGHSDECFYNETIDATSQSLDLHGNYEGGGECKNCQHNTEGINCNKCKPKYYRPYGSHWNEATVCQHCDCDNFYSTGNCEEETGRCECRKEFQEPDCKTCSYGNFGYPNCRPCECNLDGTNGYHCESSNGKCPCKPNFGGDYCKVCADGYYGLPDCNYCNCNEQGSLNDICDFGNGQCVCKSNFDGQQCDRCKDGYYNYPSCLYCNCDLQGTLKEVCSKEDGKCLCKEGYGGPRCDQCLPGYYNYPDCIPCNCSQLGSTSAFCDATGKCPCLPNFAGKQCTQCSTGYYAFPECLSCNCEIHGSKGISCNNEGQCFCSDNFDSKTCNQCKEGFYNFPACEECNCDPAGVIAKFAGCGSVPAGELCQCKERVFGRICDQCKPLYWNLNITNPDGCEECSCYIDGTIGAMDTCQSKSGQCACKSFVTGRSCSECKDGAFDLNGGSLFGCNDCDCDIGGSINPVCNKGTGQCKCHPRISGRTCSNPLTTHYFPTLYQNQFEFEDGYTPSGSIVRYLYDEDKFPGYSKRGYATFGNIQNEIRNEVNIFKSSVYRMVIRYVNPTDDNIVAHILIQSDNPSEVDQASKVLFKPTNEPQFVTVSGSKGDIPSPIVLDPGRYTISVKNDKVLFLDYFVLLPAAYYEASILTKKIENPCELDNLSLCRHYKYPAIIEFQPSYEPFLTNDNKAFKPTEFYTDDKHLSLIKENRLPMITAEQPNLNYIVNVPRSGPYIVVIDYITHRISPEPYIVRVNLVGDEGDDADGVATLYPCTYTTVCRQPVIDAESREKIFHMDTTDLRPIEIIGDDPIKVAIKSIAMIPIEEWSIDLITPNPVCVMQSGKCVQTTFLTAPDSKKIEFELDHEDKITATNPIDMYDNSTKLVYLDSLDSTIEVRSKVPTPGRYHILVNFYQPNHQQFSIDYKITTDKTSHNGKLPLRNCPSNSGCRELIRPIDNSMWFDIDESILLTLTNTHQRGVWLDNILLVPAEEFTENLLHEETFDRTKEFIKNCGQDHFFIQLNASDFCKQAVFSLTSDYNNGALPCNCDYSGSTSFECDPFGGQCQCKSNIIGRQCEACRTGYYGFPDCKKCDCPTSTVCEPDTGACVCPTNVVGDKCDRCDEYAFGFNQIVGCELCKCNSLGVNGGNLQCDLNNGTCDCRTHIEGRTCDKCINGFYNFPYCEPCNCLPEGTTFDICNQEDASCNCKKNVIGQSCDNCAYGTYDLQDSNPEGCTKCFCFGKTTTCDRAYLRPFNVSMLRDASINTINLTTSLLSRWPLTPKEISINDTMLEADFSDTNPEEGLVYFGVLDYLLNQNNHLTAYGGYLSYTLYYSTGLFGKALLGADVILDGRDEMLIHQSYEQPANAINFYGFVKIIESNFRTVSGGPVSRELFMTTLRHLNAIYIRANYWEGTIISRLSDVYLTMADHDEDNYDLYTELSVEKCQCPPGYDGLSCEDCAPGYYRDPNGPHGGYCIPCQCNGHSKTCDCKTGVCDECLHSTTGDHCDQCIVGYHGNATRGTPFDCMICACPMPIDSNNFATSCEISEHGDKIYCNCKSGYTGARCQSCAAGFFGVPEDEGDYCKPCDCSGNIDTNEIGSCDTVTGECLQCLNNTSGAACNLCASGFYGDAVKLKDCQSCICDQLGTEHCDNYVGTCHCHDNVIGDKCDRCEIDHYGFDSGLGCKSCDCGVASNSTQCDDHTGDCRCKPGVTGRQCDRCLPGYWNYSESGCIPCSCNTDYSRGLGCNAQTGQCECLPGVIGEKCDACPHRWVLIPDNGCHQCDICHHALLDVTDSLRNELNPVVDEFKSTASGYFTAQKLHYLNETVDDLLPNVTALDPNGVNLSPLTEKIDALEQEIKPADRRVHYARERATDLSLNGNKLLNDSHDLLDVGRLVHTNVMNTVNDVQQLADSFDASDSSLKNERAVEEGEEILLQLKSYPTGNGPSRQLESTNDYLEQLERFGEPVRLQNEQLLTLRNEIGLFSDKMEDLIIWSLKSMKLTEEARKLYDKYKNATVNSKFDTVNDQAKETTKNIENTDIFGKKGSITMGEVKLNMMRLDDTNNQLKSITDDVDTKLPIQDEEYEDLHDIITNAEGHQNDLVVAAKQLSNDLSNVTTNSETALKAANAYSNIVDAVYNAKNTIRDANYAARNATELCDGIENRAGEADKVARDMLNEASKSLYTVQNELQPHLQRTSQAVHDILDTNHLSDDQTLAINKALEQLPRTSITNLWQKALDTAVESENKAKTALDILKPIVKDLPDKLEAAKQMPKIVDDTNNNIIQVKSQVQKVIELHPQVQEIIDKLSEKQDDTNKIYSDLNSRMAAVQNQIEMAREVANSIKVGVAFQPSTTLELKPPSDVTSLGTNSRISTFVKTDKPNGFLLYLGNENKTSSSSGGGGGSGVGGGGSGSGKRNKHEDFMALEIENGYPILTVDFGNGPQKVISKTHIADGQWHEVIVERSGNLVKLIVREETDGKEQYHEVEETLPGNNSVFNIDPETSKLFVGGYPVDFNIQDGLKYSSFDGEMENLRIGDQEMGLWNFVDAQDNKLGSKERDRLIESDVPTTGYRFSGHGYVILDSKPYMFRQRSSVQFKFKVTRDVKDGLIFYAGKNRHYISVGMKNGAIFFQYKLGEHNVSLGIQSDSVNDGQWHRVAAERDGRKGVLKIDGNVIYQDETPKGTEEFLKISDSMYFGGYPGKINHTEIITKNFDGCIDDVFIGGTPVDLHRNLKSYGVRSGCPDKLSRVLSYAPGQTGYLRLGNVNSDNHFQINLKFRTTAQNGVIFYGANNDQSETIGLAIKDGILVLNSHQQELTTGTEQFNNGEWHVVTATHDAKRLRMNIHESENFVSDIDTEPLNIQHGDIYFGGLPDNFKTPKGVLATNEPFIGCISDVTLGGQSINFANSTDRKSGSLDDCSRDIFDIIGSDIVYTPAAINTNSRTNVVDENFIDNEKVNREKEKEAAAAAAAEEEEEEEEALRVKQEQATKQRKQEEKLAEEERAKEDRREQKRKEQERERERKRLEDEQREELNKQNELDGDNSEGEDLPNIMKITPPEQTTVVPITAPPPTRRRPIPKNTTQPICALPIEPEIVTDFETGGYRFGTATDSHIQFTQVTAKLKKAYDISLEFRANGPDGILFYAADARHTDYIALYMKNGILYHSFNCGSGMANISSQKTYNDNKWHNVLFSRQQTKGKLIIDGDDEQTGESSGNTRGMNVQQPFYVGGAPSEVVEDMNINLKLSKDDIFKGCIKNIELAGRSLGEPSAIEGAQPCSDLTETGIFFGRSGGYVKLSDRFKVGTELTINLEIKPRVLDALILSVYGKTAYFVLQLVGGNLTLTVGNGQQFIVATFSPEVGDSFCDGKWHKISAVKSNYVITLQVDGINSQPAFDVTGTSASTDTTRPLFLGGHPHINKARGIKSRKPYIGCMRNINIKGIPEITPSMTVGNVQTGACPTN